MADVRAGHSAALVLRGEAGVGKTALLRYAAQQAFGFRVAQIASVEAEAELAFAGVLAAASWIGVDPERLEPGPPRPWKRAGRGRPGTGRVCGTRRVRDAGAPMADAGCDFPAP
jgi:hypothetical protein